MTSCNSGQNFNPSFQFSKFLFLNSFNLFPVSFHKTLSVNSYTILSTTEVIFYRSAVSFISGKVCLYVANFHFYFMLFNLVSRHGGI